MLASMAASGEDRVKASRPINLLLDQVEWKPIERSGELPEGRYATHEGVLRIEGIELRCCILNDGERVFLVDDVMEFFGAEEYPEAGK